MDKGDILQAAYVSQGRQGRTALLIAIVAALSGMAGWAIGHATDPPAIWFFP
jgi:hypothetical protein